jgi:hypothetical protein
MNGPVAVQTTFTLKKINITLATAGTGSGTIAIAPTGTNCGANCNQYDYGTPVSITATQSTGSTFTTFSGGGCSTTNPCNFNVSATATVTATFNINQYTLTVTKAGGGTGTITGTGGISCPGTCSATINYGTSVTLTPSWSGGNVFNGFSGGSGACGGTIKCTFTMTANASTTGTFTAVTPITWDPNWSVAGATYSNGNLSVSGNTAGTKDIRTTVGKANGKWYWEVTATGGNGTNNGGLGLADTTWPNTSNYVGYLGNSLGFGYGGDTYYAFGWATPPSSPGPGSAIKTGTVYMFALDMNTQQLWIGQNGTWYNNGNPAAGTGAVETGLGATTVFPALTFYANSINSFTADFGQSMFNYSVPAGFNPGFYYSSDGTDGYPAQFPQAGSFSQDYLLGEQINVPTGGVLLRFGVISSAAGPQVKMGLYTDSGGNPNTLVAQMSGTLVAGVLEVPAQQVYLPAGNYWLLADYNTGAGPYQEAFGTTTNSVHYISETFATALPSTWPVASQMVYNGAHFNYYVVVAE